MADNTEEQGNDEPQLIETIFYELDQSSFALALIGGAIIGGFILYLYLQREKTLKSAIAVVEETVAEPEPIEEVVIPADGGWNWDLQQQEEATVEQPGFGHL